MLRGKQNAKKMRLILIMVLVCAGFTSISCTMTDAGDKKPTSVIAYGDDGDARADTAMAAPPATVTVALTGDIMLGTTYPEPALPPDDGRQLFADVRSVLLAADITTGNLEGAICDTTFARSTSKSERAYLFRMPPHLAPRLKEAGFDLLSLANNHSLDFGYGGARATERTLDGLGISHAGLQGRNECPIVERRGVKFGFCAFGHNYYTLKHKNLGKAKTLLDSLRRNADIVIVSFHGGSEGTSASHLPYGKETFMNEDRGELRAFAHFCIDNGADIVFGHGPHVLRCIELYKDRFIAYSLGNFCTPYGISIMGKSGYAPVVEVSTDLDGRFVSGQVHSFIQHKGAGPKRDTANHAATEIRKLTNTDIRDGRLEISREGKISIKK